MNIITPILLSNFNVLDNHIFIKRDDLLPFSFGGNKARIANEYFDDMKKKGFNCIIGYGNARSNLSRVIANMSYSKGIPCHIISPDDEDGSRIETYNSFIVKKCNATFHTCLKNEVAVTVEKVIEECKNYGLKPYYIYGDKFGSSNKETPVNAYVKAYEEMLIQFNEMKINYDYIFLSTGTGMTQAGLIVGNCINKGKEKIIGISISRNKQQEEKIILEYLNAYCDFNHIQNISEDKINIVDDYLCGGYGFYNDCILEIIEKNMKENGLPLDPIYTGKGFYGMCEYLKKENIKNKNILFIHTGGSPLFFDHIKLLK